MIEPLMVLAPLAIGVGLGLAGISNLMRMLLARFEKATLGVLLGLLLGAVLGLWPFQHGLQPQVGDVIEGRPVTAGIHREDRSEGLSPGTVRPCRGAGRIVDRTGSGGFCTYTRGCLGRTRPSGVLTACVGNGIPLIDDHQCGAL